MAMALMEELRLPGMRLTPIAGKPRILLQQPKATSRHIEQNADGGFQDEIVLKMPTSIRHRVQPYTFR